MQALLNVPKINPKCFDRNYKWSCFVNLCSLKFDYVFCDSKAVKCESVISYVFTAIKFCIDEKPTPNLLASKHSPVSLDIPSLKNSDSKNVFFEKIP